VELSILKKDSAACSWLWKLECDTKLFQTHISENPGEVAAVEELYPDCKNYADVYDKAKLLTDKVSFCPV